MRRFPLNGRCMGLRPLVWALCALVGLAHATGAGAQSWCARPPRAGLEALERVAVADDWFQVFRVERGVYALVEPYNAQEVISWLILGESRALLFDTGMGMSRIGAVVRELTSLPVTVLNSHSHTDHIGGNAEFDSILAVDTPFGRERAAGAAHGRVADEVTPAAFCGARLRVAFDTAAYSIRPFVATGRVADGAHIDLGARTLEVLHVPGHAPDAVALLDRARGLLWTGDTFYEGPIWLYSPGTDLDAYGRSVVRLASLAPTLRRVLPGHNLPVAAPQRLVQVRDGFARVRSGALPPALPGDGTATYALDARPGGLSFVLRQPQPATQTAPPLRVLFIGNSYTYYHNLPDVLAALAAGAAMPRQVHVAMEVVGGSTLQQHWLRGRALARIEDERWDFVVLQEQSMLGVHLREGQPAINAPDLLHQSVRLFDRAIRRSGARTVLYSTWSRRGAAAANQGALDAAYASIGAEIGALVAPVGTVWQQVRSARPDLELYDPDGSHPSAAGTYLAATVLLGVIEGQLPAALPSTVRGRPVLDLATGSRVADTLATLVALPESTATFVQRTTADVLRQAQSGARSVAPVTPAPDPLGAGAPLSAATLLGRWTGTLRLYDAPAAVELEVTAAGGILRGRWTEHYAGDAGTLSLVVRELRLEGNMLRFTVADPRFVAAPSVHRAILRDGRLEGVAEIGSAAQVPYLVGRWSLHRRSGATAPRSP